MTIRELKQRKQELGYTNEQVASLSGVPLGTVQKIFAGATKAPRRETLEALWKILRPGPASYESRRPHSPSMIRDALPAFEIRQKGPYTIDDYYDLPDNVRCELIDGYFYDMAAPSNVHQVLIGELHVQFYNCIAAHPERDCIVMLSPFDVHLFRDRTTMVQPDLLISCGNGELTQKRYEGAPDLAVEVLSPSSRGHDMLLKLNKYCDAGVREYWIVDPQNWQILVYDFEVSDAPQQYDFTEKVPVAISDGTCEIDFGAITGQLKRHRLI